MFQDTGEGREPEHTVGAWGRKEAGPVMPALSACSQQAHGRRAVIWNEFRKPRLILSAA